MRILISNTLCSLLMAIPKDAKVLSLKRIRRGLWRCEYIFV